MGQEATPPKVLDQVLGGALVAASLVIVARVTLSIVLARWRLSVPIAAELACCLVLPIGMATALGLFVRPPVATIVGALGATPIGFAVADGLVDTTLTRARPEMAPMAHGALVGCSALAATCLLVGLLVLIVKLAGRHLTAVVTHAASIATACTAIVLLHAATTAAAPDLETWRAFTARLEDQMRTADALAVLDDDPSRVVELSPPPFFDRAFATRVPELPEDYAVELAWAVPTRHPLRLGRFGLRGTRDVCLLQTGAHVVVLESARGVLLLRRHEGRDWCACGDEGSDWAGLVASHARFGTYGAPSACAWALALGVLASAFSLGLAWRARRMTARIGRMTLGDVVGEDRRTVRLVGGTLVHVTAAIPPRTETVLVEAAPRALEYRDDARTLVTTWIAAPLGRAPIERALEQRIALRVALGLVLAVWLALPAVSALSHGFVVSLR